MTPAAAPLAQASGAAVEATALTKRFGEFEAVSALDLTIPAGSLYGLVGPNGAGKTTLYRLVAGLLKPSAGELRVLGGPPGRTEARAATGYMTQSEALYGDLSVRANVTFFARLFGLRGEALDQAVQEAVELVALTDRLDDRVDRLSGGMRRRVALATAVVHRPRLLLLDEPTAGVDPALRALFWDAFARWTDAGATVVISTHHIEEAHRCDRLGLLRRGSLIAEGAPAELLERTGRTSMEAAFIALAQEHAG